MTRTRERKKLAKRTVDEKQIRHPLGLNDGNREIADWLKHLTK